MPTQELVYETADQDHLARMLRLALDTMYTRPNSQYAVRAIRAEQGSFDDGKDYNWGDKPLVWHEGHQYHIFQRSKMYGGALTLQRLHTENTADRAAAWACDHHEKQHTPRPKYLWITTLHNYKGAIKPEDQVFENNEAMATAAMHLVAIARQDKKAQFLAECGDGYCDWFNHNDGSVGVGYRLNHRPNGGWDEIDISLCHIYYGK